MIALALPAMLMLAPAARAPAPAMAVDGIWQSACAPIGKNGRHGYIVTVRIAHGRFDGRADLYATPACASPTLRIDFRAARLDLRAVGDHTDLAMTVRSVRLTPLRQDVVDLKNAGARHGPWRLGRSRSIAGQASPPFTFPAIGARVYDRAWLSGDALRFASLPLRWQALPTAVADEGNGVVFRRVGPRSPSRRSLPRSPR